MCEATPNMLHFQRFCHHWRSQDGGRACDLDHTRRELPAALRGLQAQKLKTVTLGDEPL
jgi:hypothetical protein